MFQIFLLFFLFAGCSIHGADKKIVMPTTIPTNIVYDQSALIYQNTTNNRLFVNVPDASDSEHWGLSTDPDTFVGYDITKDKDFFLVIHDKKENKSTLTRVIGGMDVNTQHFANTCFHDVTAIDEVTCLTLELKKEPFLKKFFGFGGSVMKIFETNTNTSFDMHGHIQLPFQLSKFIPLEYKRGDSSSITGIGCDAGYLKYIVSCCDATCDATVYSFNTPAIVKPIHIHLPGRQFEERIRHYQVHRKENSDSVVDSERIIYTLIVETARGEIIVARCTHSGNVQSYLLSELLPDAKKLKAFVAFIEDQSTVKNKIVPAQLLLTENRVEPIQSLRCKIKDEMWRNQPETSRYFDPFIRFLVIKRNALLASGAFLGLLWVLRRAKLYFKR
jgi:hypothetical protein